MPDSAAMWELSPAELVTRIRTGDRTAEGELVARYSRGVSVILRRIAGSAGPAEDLHQDVFLRVIEKVRAGEVREPEKLSGFICGLARNLAIGYFRRQPHAEDVDAAGNADRIEDPSPGPLEHVLSMEDARTVKQVLSELRSGRDRDVLLRFYLGDEDKGAICRDLGITSLQFNRVLHRARERFRELYTKSQEGSRENKSNRGG